MLAFSGTGGSTEPAAHFIQRCGHGPSHPARAVSAQVYQFTLYRGQKIHRVLQELYKLSKFSFNPKHFLGVVHFYKEPQGIVSKSDTPLCSSGVAERRPVPRSPASRHGTPTPFWGLGSEKTYLLKELYIETIIRNPEKVALFGYRYSGFNFKGSRTPCVWILGVRKPDVSFCCRQRCFTCSP